MFAEWQIQVTMLNLKAEISCNFDICKIGSFHNSVMKWIKMNKSLVNQEGQSSCHPIMIEYWTVDRYRHFSPSKFVKLNNVQKVDVRDGRSRWRLIKHTPQSKTLNSKQSEEKAIWDPCGYFPTFPGKPLPWKGSHAHK